MANIKGITIQLGADTTSLTAALKKVNSEIRNTQSDLREVEKLLKFDGGNSDLLVQKQKSLADAIESTKEKLKQEQEALKQLQSGEQNSNTIKQQEALTREIEKTKQSLTNLQSQYKSFGSVDIQKHEAAVKKLNEQLSTTKDRLKTVNEALKLDPGNTELLAEKQKLLADAIQQTKEKLTEEKAELEALKNAPQTDDIKQKQADLTVEIQKTSAELKTLESEYKSFGSVDIQQHEAQVKKLNDQLTETKNKLTDVNTALKLDPGNTELLVQKQKLLQRSVLRLKKLLIYIDQSAAVHLILTGNAAELFQILLTHLRQTENTAVRAEPPEQICITEALKRIRKPVNGTFIPDIRYVKRVTVKMDKHRLFRISLSDFRKEGRKILQKNLFLQGGIQEPLSEHPPVIFP